MTSQQLQLLILVLIAPVLPIPVASTSVSSATVTPSGPGEKKKRGRKPKNSALEPGITGPMLTASPVKSSVSIGGPDTIKSPRTAGTSSGWRGPAKDSASFQVSSYLKQ